jgi:hypothetical protein
MTEQPEPPALPQLRPAIVVPDSPLSIYRGSFTNTAKWIEQMSPISLNTLGRAWPSSNALVNVLPGAGGTATACPRA